jgi:hypothetical protein
MTPSEFKCWFQGYTEALEGTPSVAQWARIKARVAEIDGRAITEHIYINRYVPSYHPNYYYGTPYTVPYTLCGPGAVGTSIGSGTIMTNCTSAMAFNSHDAMLSLGRAEAQEIN